MGRQIYVCFIDIKKPFYISKRGYLENPKKRNRTRSNKVYLKYEYFEQRTGYWKYANKIKKNFLNKKSIPKNVKLVWKIVKTTLTYTYEAWALTQRRKSRGTRYNWDF